MLKNYVKCLGHQDRELAAILSLSSITDLLMQSLSMQQTLKVIPHQYGIADRPTVHDFCVICVHTWASARMKHKRFPLS